MSSTGLNGSSARPSSPKRKRSEYEGEEDFRLPEHRSRTAPSHDDTNGYAYDSSSPAPSDLDPSTPTTPPPPAPPQRPTSLPYTPTLTLKGHTRGVSAVAFSPSGTHLATCSADATLKIWDLTAGSSGGGGGGGGSCTQTLEGHLAGISCVAWNRDGSVLASGADDKVIRLWDVKAGKSFATALAGHSNYVSCLAFSPKGNMLVSGSYDEAVFLWDVRTGGVMRQLPAHSDPVTGVDFVRDGTLVASCSSDGLIRIWDAGTGQCLKTLVHEDNASVGSVRFSPNGRFVLAATLDGCVRLWDYVEGKVLKTYSGHRNTSFSLNVCIGTYGSKLEQQRIGGAKEVHGDDMQVDGEEEGISEKVDGSGHDVDTAGQTWAFVACGDEDGKLILWDVNTKEVLHTAQGHDGPILGISTSPDSGRIATCGQDGTVKVWAMRLDNGDGNVS